MNLPGWTDASIAVAGSRAGGLGIVDLECLDDVAAARALLRGLADYADLALAVRVDGGAVGLLEQVARAEVPNVCCVILTASRLGPSREALREPLAALRRRKLRLLVSVSEADEAVVAESLDPDGLVAKGNEAAGWVGEETSFVLLQRLLARGGLPVWVHGGIGSHTVAACYAAGAAGVVLDSQLALLRESLLPEVVRTAVERMDGSETVLLGTELDAQCRLYARPRHNAVDELREAARRLGQDPRPRPDVIQAWRAEVRDRIGWDSGRRLWLLGQDAAFASGLAHRFRTVAATVRGLRESIGAHCRAARTTRPLAEGSALARSHGTRYPILQGPMTRVSDTAAFAVSVAQAGALPFLALALMRGPEVRSLLQETASRIGDRPWGVGILGFVPVELRQEQLDAVLGVRPPFALIAGGRPDQALLLERAGIPTYLHVPSPGLLKMFLEAGAARFVFEGRECGGHVGPRSSFVLWELMIDVLLDALPAGPEAERYHVVFAGGVHDALSSAMVATMTAPLAARGVRIGVLLGTAYLFTDEAVASGAIVGQFQREALACTRTILLETGPGHSTRCAATAFGEVFSRERHRLLADRTLSQDEVRQELEALNLGRLRIASKGIVRNPAGGGPDAAPRHAVLDEARQRAEGMYMIGQVAALRDRTGTMGELHDDVSRAGTERLARIEPPSVPAGRRMESRPADVAIIGIGCLLPKAPDVHRYWENILNKVDAITEIPPNRWDWRLYYDPDRRAPDKIYSKWGGFVEAVPFDPARYGMPPNTLRSIEPMQLLALEVVRAALADAGYAERPFPRERTGVILGVGGGAGDLGQEYAVRSQLPMYVGDGAAAIMKQLPEWTEDSFAGILLNVVAGRVANRFDLGGVNYTVDAACASSLAAVYLAVRELEAGTADMMLVGGADTVQNPFAYLSFAKTQALSPRGRCHTFDAGADGIAISEGHAVLVLKRLEDAERDGDRIYAVIKAVAGSSDGRDRGLTAPRPEGQIRALERAYAAAGFSPDTLGLVEAHGTGTVAGDQAEVESLTRVFLSRGTAHQSCAIGSVKSMIGHTKCTAGVAGLAKIALALHHRILPPTLHVEQPNPKVFGAESPLYVNTEARPWIARPDGTPRRAGVSAFGFGGTNFHVVVEEYPDQEPRAAVREWPSELLVWSGTRAEIQASLDSLIRALSEGAKPLLRDLAYSLWERARARREADVEPGLALGIVAETLVDLQTKLRDASGGLSAGRGMLADPRGIFFTDAPLGRAGRVAWLFPGQGSHQVDMLQGLALHFPELREAFASADRALADRLPRALSSYVFPPPRFGLEAERACQAALTRTNVAQPALGAAGHGMAAVLGACGMRPDMVGGHSYGEFVALSVAGVFDAPSLYVLSEARGRAILASAGGNDLGTMAAVQADVARTAAALGDLPEVWISNANAPAQTMISGSRRGIDQALRQLEAQGLSVRPIPVDCGFHSPLVAPARDAFARHLAGIAYTPPRVPVFSNTTAAEYPADSAAIAEILTEHLVTPVRFAEQVRAMYRAGARVFVEVGPGSVLTGLVQQNLGAEPHVAASPGAAGRSPLFPLQSALAQLLAHGVELDLGRLFAGRSARRLDLDALVRVTREAELPATAWLVHGGAAWPAREKAPVPPTPITLAAAGERAEALEAGAPRPAVSGKAAPLGQGLSVPSPRPALSAQVTGPGPAEGRGPADVDVMRQFQSLMNRFLETQRSVMMAYLQGAPAALPAAGPVEPRLSVALRAEAAPAAPSPELPVPSGAVLASPAPEPAGATRGPEPASPDSERERLTQALVRIVSDRTGYPPEMLNLDLNMEADLGIDSIKRVEILGAFHRQHLGGASAEGLMEKLTNLKSLGQILDAVFASLDRGAAPPAREEVPPAAQARPAGEPPAPMPSRAVEVDRWVVEAAPVSLEAQLPLSVGDRLLILTDDEGGIAGALAGLLRQRGGTVVLLRPGDRRERLADGTDVVPLENPDEVAELLRVLRRERGSIGGVVHLTPLGRRGALHGGEVDPWRARLARDLKGLVHLLQAAGGDIRDAAMHGGGFVVTATALGIGFGGLDSSSDFDPTQGGLTGLVKSLALEWPEVRCKVVDVEPDGDPLSIATQVLTEMATADGRVEIGYRRGRRHQTRVRRAHLAIEAPERLSPEASWVWLITGGARGITAEIACELAVQYQPTIILVGRSPLPTSSEKPPTAGLSGPALKRALIQEMSGACRPPAPAAVEAAYTRLLNDREIRQNIALMSETGAKVQYEQADVRDERALRELVEEIYASHGRLDGVVHGAGVIEDKLLGQKTLESFDRVLHTKVDGAYALARALRPESTRLLVFFASVAGRFGNRGQTDYAAANEILGKLARQLNHQWPGRVVALHWGPWGRTGMVSTEVERQFLERGLQIIPPAAGRRAFDEEIRFGAKEDCEVAFGGGLQEPDGRAARAPAAVLPMLRQATGPRLGEGGGLEVERRLDPAHDRYLLDHQLDGKPVFPVAMAMELMAEVVQQGWPGWQLVRLRSLRVLRGIVLDDGPTSLSLVARQQVQSADAGGLAIDVQVSESRSGRPSYRATVELGDRRVPPAPESMPVLPTLRPFPMSVRDAYDQWLFHGPCFARIVELEGTGGDWIAARVEPSAPGSCLADVGDAAWLIDPIVVDCGFQLSILWARLHLGMTPLPAKLGAYRRVAEPSGSPLRVLLHGQASAGGSVLNTQIYLVEPPNRLIAVLEDMEFSCSRALNRLGGSAARASRHDP